MNKMAILGALLEKEEEKTVYYTSVEKYLKVTSIRNRLNSKVQWKRSQKIWRIQLAKIVPKACSKEQENDPKHTDNDPKHTATIINKKWDESLTVAIIIEQVSTYMEQEKEKRSPVNLQ